MRALFIVGPTATGKSDLAAEVARRCNAEIVSADAFQIYRGLDLLTAKPDHETLAKVPHHLLSAIPLSEEMNAEKFRALARETIEEIHARAVRPRLSSAGAVSTSKRSHMDSAPLPAANRKLRDTIKSIQRRRIVRASYDVGSGNCARNRQEKSATTDSCDRNLPAHRATGFSR